MELRKFLREVETFSSLTDAEIDKLAALCRDRVLRKGETVYAEREPGDRFFVIESGSVELSRLNGGAAPVRIAVLEHGEIFGELAVFEERPRSATATATRDNTKLKVIEKKELEGLLAADAALAVRLLRGMLRKAAARLRLADEAIQALIRALDA
jgi:CRP-like cAMP-binding protein